MGFRSVFLNYDWEAFQEYRIETDNRKLYPNRELIEAILLSIEKFRIFQSESTLCPINRYMAEGGLHPLIFLQTRSWALRNVVPERLRLRSKVQCFLGLALGA